MIAEIGHFALILALGLALVQGTVPLYGASRRDASLMAVATPTALGLTLFVGIAFASLMYGYVVSDFSIFNVAANSHSAKPMLYKITGVWGNHEGSILLWILILSLFGAAVAIFGRNLPASLHARVLSIQALIAVGFLLFLLLTSNPFVRLDPPPLDGNGLNPLLQDPGLAFHPPFLYLGYVGFSIAFSFAIAALLEGRVDPAWGRWVRPWTLAAWSALTLGNALGSWWAYYELGWGGWWFWDPVENASFMPWLAGTALLHSAIVVEKRDALKSWTILLAIVTFSLSLLGTFLVRSGVLTSVHAFATDPARGVFILIFLALAIGGSLALYAARASALQASGMFAPISREGALLLNNFLLATALGTVLLGTLYPLFLDALTGEKVSVGPPYFNATFVPLMAPLVVVMGVGPFLAWKRSDLMGVLARLKVAALVSIVALIWVWARSTETSILVLVGVTVASWLLAATLVQVGERIKLFSVPLGQSLRRAMRLGRAHWGMTFAHAGLGITILGMVGAGGWQSEFLGVMGPGDTVNVGPYQFAFRGTGPTTGPNYKAMRGHFTVTRDGKTIAELYPEARSYPVPPVDTTEAAIYPMLRGDLYAVIGAPDDADESEGAKSAEATTPGGWGVRLYYKPLVSWIWAGALLMAFGGIVSLSDRRLRVGVPRRRKVAGSKPPDRPEQPSPALS